MSEQIGVMLNSRSQDSCCLSLNWGAESGYFDLCGVLAKRYSNSSGLAMVEHGFWTFQAIASILLNVLTCVCASRGSLISHQTVPFASVQSKLTHFEFLKCARISKLKTIVIILKCLPYQSCSTLKDTSCTTNPLEVIEVAGRDHVCVSV